MTTGSTLYSDLIAAWKARANDNRLLTIAFLAALVLVSVLALISLGHALLYGNPAHFKLAIYGGLAGFAATAAGSVLIFFVGQVRPAIQDSLLGFAAGMMLAASSFSLILPGVEAAQELFTSLPLAALTVVCGLGLGTLLMVGMDHFTPHEHACSGVYGPELKRLSGIWLFVFAIALHNIPEGMAIGVSFAHGDLSVGLPLTMAIMIQDVPEGLAVALALRATGMSRTGSALAGAATGLLEPLGAILGFSIANSLPVAYPLSMGLAAGAMIFVVSNEVIPETHRNGHQTLATLGLMGGFMVMMFLDVALG